MESKFGTKVLLLDGSAASPSRVAMLLKTIAAGMQAQGCKITSLELSQLRLPINDPEFHTNPQDHPDEAVRRLVALVEESDTIVLGTPLYHGSYSGLLKMALDHLTDDAFAGKPVGLVSNANGPHNSMQAAQDLVLVARTMKGDVDNCIIGTSHADYGVKDDIFQVINQDVLKRIDTLVSGLVARAK